MTNLLPKVKTDDLDGKAQEQRDTIIISLTFGAGVSVGFFAALVLGVL